MDWIECNSSPQRDWVDRRSPQHVFQQGVLNRRAPATGFGGDRGTGVAFEHMVALANAAGRDLWINVPHLATDDFITRLAQLIRFGSDGVNPYTNVVANPVYPPLNPNRQVFVEYSNEIWSNGDSFSQGNWAQEQANALGISKPQFNARRFCQGWRIFQSVFAGESSRVVRVAAVWTGLQSYTEPFLNEIAAYGPTLTPPQTADVIAPTTYFGNGIQDWAFAKARQQAGTTDSWFFTTNTFVDGATVKPVSLAANDPYWTGTNVTRHLAATFTGMETPFAFRRDPDRRRSGCDRHRRRLRLVVAHRHLQCIRRTSNPSSPTRADRPSTPIISMVAMFVTTASPRSSNCSTASRSSPTCIAFISIKPKPKACARTARSWMSVRGASTANGGTWNTRTRIRTPP